MLPKMPLSQSLCEVAAFFRVALLQSEVGTKYFGFSLRNLSKKSSENVPKFLGQFVGLKRSAKFPPNFPQDFPAKIQKDFTDELLQERMEKHFE